MGFRGRQAIPKPTAAAPARPHHHIPSQLSLHTPGKSNGYSSFLACAGGAKSEGKEKKNYYKCSTNYESRGRAFVPALLDFALSLVFPQLRLGATGTPGLAKALLAPRGQTGSAQAREPPGFKI